MRKTMMRSVRYGQTEAIIIKAEHMCIVKSALCCFILMMHTCCMHNCCFRYIVVYHVYTICQTANLLAQCLCMISDRAVACLPLHTLIQQVLYSVRLVKSPTLVRSLTSIFISCSPAYLSNSPTSLFTIFHIARSFLWEIYGITDLLFSINSFHRTN